MTNKEYTERRGSLIILTVAVILILIIILTGIAVLLFADKDLSKIILIVLIALLILVAISSFAFLEIQRKNAQKKRDQGARELVQKMYEQQKYQTQAPERISSSDNKTATWALTKPWRYSQRSTLRAQNDLY